MHQALQKHLYLSQITRHHIPAEFVVSAVMYILMKTFDFVITLHDIVLGVLW